MHQVGNFMSQTILLKNTVKLTPFPLKGLKATQIVYIKLQLWKPSTCHHLSGWIRGPSWGLQFEGALSSKMVDCLIELRPEIWVNKIVTIC